MLLLATMHTITACSGDEDVPDNPNLKKNRLRAVSQ